MKPTNGTPLTIRDFDEIWYTSTIQQDKFNGTNRKLQFFIVSKLKLPHFKKNRILKVLPNLRKS